MLEYDGMKCYRYYSFKKTIHHPKFIQNNMIVKSFFLIFLTVSCGMLKNRRETFVSNRQNFQKLMERALRNLLLRKIKAKIVHRQVCNSTTCNKCQYLVTFRRWEDAKMKKICMNLINLDNCCSERRFLSKKLGLF